MAERDKLDIPEGRFPSNSYSSIRPAAKGQPVTEQMPEKATGTPAKAKKKTLVERIADAFIATTKDDVKEYVIFDVLIPGLKRGVEEFIHMVLYNDKRAGRIAKSRGESRMRRVGYSSIYGSSRDDEPALSTKVRSPYTDLTFDTEADAESVLDSVTDRIEDRGFATLSYFNAVAGVPYDWTQNEWGWHTTVGAKIYQLRSGRWILKMPRLEEL